MNKWLLLASLYVAQFLPLAFFGQTIPIFLRQQGISLKLIGLTSLWRNNKYPATIQRHNTGLFKSKIDVHSEECQCSTIGDLARISCTRLMTLVK
jgi:hypothetical protein